MSFLSCRKLVLLYLMFQKTFFSGVSMHEPFLLWPASGAIGGRRS